MRQSDYEALAAFRLEIRRFMAFSQQILDTEGLPPAQYQAMLAIQAHASKAYSIGDLAGELHIRVQTAVELVGRMQTAGLVQRRPSPNDRRRILLTLSDRGQALRPHIAERHLLELRAKTPSFRAALGRFSDEGTHGFILPSTPAASTKGIDMPAAPGSGILKSPERGSHR